MRGEPGFERASLAVRQLAWEGVVEFLEEFAQVVCQ